MIKEKKKKTMRRLVMVASSLILGAIVCEYIGDSQEESVRNAFYYITNDSIINYHKVTLDAAGIPYVDYLEENGITPGRQYNPTIIATNASNLYHELEKNPDSLSGKHFRNCIKWLKENITRVKGNALYEFNWQQPWYPSVKVPFTSGLSSACAIEAFTNAQKLYPAENYLQYAKELLRGFYLPIDSGGFTYKEKEGWWYEEFADSNRQTPRILDGHIYCILGIREYFLFTKDDSASFIIQQGLNALKHHLPEYDKIGEKVCYDIYCNPADQKYHMMLADQMKQVWNITNDSVFYRYYQKWNKPLKQPYVYRIFKQMNRSGILLYLLVNAVIFIMISFARKLLS